MRLALFTALDYHAFDVRFSITARQDKRIRAAIEQIDESALRRRQAGRPPGRL